MDYAKRHHVAILIGLVSVVPLAGCGGGGGEASKSFPVVAAKEVATNTFQINPGATWKPNPDGDYDVASLVSVDLARLNNGQPVSAGRILEVKSTGQFQFTSQGGLSSGATGLLVNAAGLALAPGTGSTVGASSASTDCSTQSTGPDTIPEDFAIPGDVVSTLVVPEGASAMRLSVNDCYYHDNSIYSTDPIRVTIILK